MICFWFPGCPLKRKFNYENLTNLNIFKFDGFSINDLTMSSNCHVHHAEGFRNKKFKLVHLIPNQRYVSSKNISFQGNHDIRRMYDLLRTSFWIVIKKFLLIHFLTVATSKNQDSRSKLLISKALRVNTFLLQFKKIIKWATKRACAVYLLLLFLFYFS